MKKIVILGAGFSSLSAANYLAQMGYKVKILEKNNLIGGRANVLKREGFTFDMGPTFYWMPDVFDKFFQDFGKKPSDYYTLTQLIPSYRIYFGSQDYIDNYADIPRMKETFEAIDPGSGQRFERFMTNAKKNYDIAIKDLVYQPGESIFELVTLDAALKLDEFVKTIRYDAKQVSSNPKIQKIIEFPILFLGATPSNTPMFYNFMNYADIGLGTWHPKGGMHQVALAMKDLAISQGVEIQTGEAALEIVIEQNLVTKVRTEKGTYDCDILLSGADYAHTEALMPEKYRQYTQNYWNQRALAPSAMLFYVGFEGKIPEMIHHSLFFDSDFEQHIAAIYTNKSWPTAPLFYTSFPSMSDDTVAPQGKEAGIFLIPIATDIDQDKSNPKDYLDEIFRRIHENTGIDLREKVIFYEYFGIRDFQNVYHSLRGNAYGLANTLLQTHILRPRLKSKKVNNMYFSGQLTVPGPGVPPAIISGNIVSQLIKKYHP
ncbi:MAG: phytoene desaturase family protein [Chitinophagales bacterium]|jgi:phytoene desaturase|nr:phytoene desaturase family protein [Chitinophagales bacterium]